jgi:ATP-dependent Clp protease ATP-binding subunit ClpA
MRLYTDSLESPAENKVPAMTALPKFKVSDEDLEDLIHKYCRDFTELARIGRFDPITGRDDEIEQAILILLQKGRKNVALLAPAGVGKTALCAGLAQQIVAGKVPEYLKDARLLEIDLASMSGGTTGPAEFQGRFLPLCRGVAERYHDPAYPKTILFIDEMHTIMPICEGSAYRGLSEVMKPYLTVGDLHVIGATTLDEFRMFVAQDPAMDRRFQKVYLSVPTVPQTIEILKNLRKSYEKHHKITVSDSAIEVIVNATEEHMRKRNQPDKSIIMMDAAMAHHVRHHGTGGELDLNSFYYMMSKETGIHPEAIKK